MKIIGLIGGMSWESTVTYYKIINEVIKNKLGGLHSAKCILYSVDFEEIEECQKKGNWDRSAEILGCTEIGLLVKQEDTDVPLFDTTNIHSTSTALYAIEE